MDLKTLKANITITQDGDIRAIVIDGGEAKALVLNPNRPEENIIISYKDGKYSITGQGVPSPANFWEAFRFPHSPTALDVKMFIKRLKGPDKSIATAWFDAVRTGKSTLE